MLGICRFLKKRARRKKEEQEKKALMASAEQRWRDVKRKRHIERWKDIRCCVCGLGFEVRRHVKRKPYCNLHRYLRRTKLAWNKYLRFYGDTGDSQGPADGRRRLNANGSFAAQNPTGGTA